MRRTMKDRGTSCSARRSFSGADAGAAAPAKGIGDAKAFAYPAGELQISNPESPIPPLMDIEKKNVALLSACQGLLLTNNSILIATNALAGYALASDKSLATLPVTA